MSTEPDADKDAGPAAAVPDIFWEITESQHTVLCAVQNGLTTARQIACHTALRSEEVRRDLWQLRDKEFVQVWNPDQYVTEALAAAEEKDEDPVFQPPKEVRLTLRARQYFGWAEVFTVFDPDRCEHTGIGEWLDDLDRRLRILEQWMQDQMKQD